MKRFFSRRPGAVVIAVGLNDRERTNKMLRRFFGVQPSIPAGGRGGLLTAASLAAESRPMHEPGLEPRDEAVFLLTAAAEVEHALMVQYLYAAYSLRVVEGEPNFQRLKELQDNVIQIAREEMGHLATVQNLLHIIGGPLNFNREHSPYASEIYPFRFKLEPLTLDSLAKYVVAESPQPLPTDFPAADKELYEQIQLDARRSNDAREVRHVGPIFARLEKLFADAVGGLKGEDFNSDAAPLQAKFRDWGFEPRSAPGEKLLVESFEGADLARLREAAVKAISDIARQGEGFDLPPAGPTQTESHFERFFEIYKQFKTLSADGTVRLTWPVAENPNTTPAPQEPAGPMRMVEMVVEAHASKGRTNHPRTRDWAHLFNLRYRMLLSYFSHFLRLNQELYAGPGPQQGDRTPRGLLLIWTFDEMRRIKKIAGKLVQLPKDDTPGAVNASPPFELPYTLNLPDREKDRWRSHLDASRAAVRLVRDTLRAEGSADATDEFLEDLQRLDEEAQALMRAVIGQGSVPEGLLPTDFKKVVLILEEAVRGFDIGAHRDFWDGITRQQFVAGGLHPLVPTLVEQNPDGTFNPDASALVIRLEHPDARRRMPRLRPKVADERLQFIRGWIQGGCPDNDPPNQPGIQRERNPVPEPAAPLAPAHPPQQALGFAADIRGSSAKTPTAVSCCSYRTATYTSTRM
jgi:hypothetical protein